ncbi:MAG: hypothetical protein ABIO86_14640 [Sphingomonas sp.]
MIDQRDYVPRRLSWLDSELQPQTICELDIFKTFTGPMVVRGEPGIGKSWLMERLGEQPKCHFVRATQFLLQPDSRFPADIWLIIDGLDEVAAVEPGDPLHNVLKKLIGCGRPPFIISCRAAEWRSLTGRLDIADAYGVVPVELTLDPLTSADAITLLSRDIDKKDAEAAIVKLDRANLSHFYTNPLTLRFVAALVQSEEGDISSRGELFDRAIDRLWRERNPRFATSVLASLSDSAALDAAGAAMATMLLTGADALTTMNTSSGALPIANLTDFADMGTLRAVLGSNLFRLDHLRLDHFLPLHRTVAEFLGARWLARQVDASSYPSRTAKRISGLISAHGGVPASLRGLNAWLPRFSHTWLGPLAIEQDPYGILLYGDGDDLTIEQARQILSGLRALADFDPHFHSGWTATLSVKGLGQSGLEGPVREIILDSTVPVRLRGLILDAIIGSPVAPSIIDDLKAVLVDPARFNFERQGAAEALARCPGASSDWPANVEEILREGTAKAAELAVDLLNSLGSELFPDSVIAGVVVTHADLLRPARDSQQARAVGGYVRIGYDLPAERITALLDVFAEIVLPSLDPNKWWHENYHDGWSEFGHLVDRLIRRKLEDAPNDVDPKKLWNWLRMAAPSHRYERDDNKEVARILAMDDRLRRGIHKMVFAGTGAEGGKYLWLWQISRISSGLAFSDEDARLYLSEISGRAAQEERDLWLALTNRFRAEDGFIPKDIQQIARPFAAGDKGLLDILTKKPARQKIDDWERQHRRKMRAREKSAEKERSAARAQYLENIEGLKKGELRWIVNPARAYLNMFRDLEATEPADRVSEWLGDDVCRASLEGFEAVLHRRDLPKAKDIAESYARSKVWNFVYPMLAGAGQRNLLGRNFADLPGELLSALAIAAEHELLQPREQFESVAEALNAQLRQDPENYENYLRLRFEPMLAQRQAHVPGLYQFVRADLERPLSTKLCLEWLERFPDIPAETDRELAGCIIHVPPDNRVQAWMRLAAIANERASVDRQSEDRISFWRSVLFLIDANSGLKGLAPITEETKDWLWTLTESFYSRFGEGSRQLTASIEQLAWIVANFRPFWPYRDRPSGVTSGEHNSWDATQLLQWAIFQIASDAGDEATAALNRLRDMPQDGYTVTIQAAIASQHRLQLEARFQAPSVGDLRAVLRNEPPTSSADVQAIVVDAIAALAKRLRGDALNPVNNFYDDRQTPRTENRCRDQMLIALGALPFGIQSPPEVAMPQGNRSDGAFVLGEMAVPLEIKGQWHKEVWTAAETQLDRFYSVDHKAASKGIYLVLWFGSDVPAGKRLRRPPVGAEMPKTPEEMRLSLLSRLPAHRRGDIAIIVLDVTLP